jgi:peroxiredoxin
MRFACLIIPLAALLLGACTEQEAADQNAPAEPASVATDESAAPSMPDSAQADRPSASEPTMEPASDPQPEISGAERVSRPGGAGIGASAGAASGASNEDADTGGDASEDDIAAIMTLLGEMREAYSTAPTLTDHVIAQFDMTGNVPEPQEYHIKLGKGQSFMFRDPQLNMWSVDGTLYITAPSRDDTFIRYPIKQDLFTTLSIITGGGQYQGMPSLYYTLRYDRPDEELIRALGLGVTGRIRLSSYRQITTEDGTELEQITLFSGDGGATINVDTETKLLHSATAEYAPPGSPGNFRIAQNFEFNPQIHEELPEPVAFDPGKRRPVPSYRGLFGLAEREPHTPDLKVAVGDQAPEFSLVTLEGERVNLSDLRGKVVVLDFWSSWCVPCVQKIPRLQQFANWVAVSGLPVEVYPVNILQREESEGQRWEKAYEWWEKREVSMKSLIDTTRTVPETYGIAMLPVTMIIDRNGRIFWMEAGIDQRLVQTLQEKVQQALEQSG